MRRLRVQRWVPAVLIAVAVALGVGCGGDSSNSSQSTVLNAPTITASQIVQQAGFRCSDSYCISYVGPGGCNVAVVLTSASQIQTYAGGGDTVVTDPTHTIGVKTVGSDPRCVQLLGQALAKVNLK